MIEGGAGHQRVCHEEIVMRGTRWEKYREQLESVHLEHKPGLRRQDAAITAGGRRRYKMQNPRLTAGFVWLNRA